MPKLYTNPEKIREADDYFGAFIRELTPTQRMVAIITRNLIKKGIYPSSNKVCNRLKRRGLNQYENSVRWKVLQAYNGSHGIIQDWRKKFNRQMIYTGLMFQREIME
jgi:hypothetical protein